MSDLISSLRAIGLSPYRHESSYSDRNAVANLKGRTHYYDADTMRYFGAKILDCTVIADGLILATVESVQHPVSGRGYRPVFFDILGNVFERPDSDVLYKSPAAARKAFDVIRAGLDPIAITRAALERKRAAIRRELDGLESVLVTFVEA